MILARRQACFQDGVLLLCDLRGSFCFRPIFLHSSDITRWVDQNSHVSHLYLSSLLYSILVDILLYVVLQASRLFTCGYPVNLFSDFSMQHPQAAKWVSNFKCASLTFGHLETERRPWSAKQYNISENDHCWCGVKFDFDAARLWENCGTEIRLRAEPRNLDQSADGSLVGARKEGEQQGLINT